MSGINTSYLRKGRTPARHISSQLSLLLAGRSALKIGIVADAIAAAQAGAFTGYDTVYLLVEDSDHPALVETKEDLMREFSPRYDVEDGGDGSAETPTSTLYLALS